MSHPTPDPTDAGAPGQDGASSPGSTPVTATSPANLESGSARRRWGPLAVGVGLWLAALAVRPDAVSGILGGLCLTLAWGWLVLPVTWIPSRRHPHLRTVARRPRVVAWRARDRWLPASRAPALWGLVLGGLVTMGIVLGSFAGRPVWWALFAPALLLASALLVDFFVLMFAGFWLVAIPLLLLFGAIPFVVEGAGRPAAIGLPVLLAGVWLADLARALHSDRPKG